MLDIQVIRESAELVKEKAKQKGYDVDVAALLQLDGERLDLLRQVEALRQRRNENADKMKGGKPEQTLIDEGKNIKIELIERESYLQDIDDKFTTLLKQVPNMPLDHVPIGLAEEENIVLREVGEKKQFDFEPKPHWEILEGRDMLDKERATKISGSRFAYLKGGLVRLQFAIVQFVLDTLADEVIIQKLIDENGLHISPKGFMPVLPPAMLRTEPYVASARLNAEEVTYKLADDDLWLNASAEHTLCTMYWNETLPEAMFPIRYIGYSSSFRREAGTYGKDTEGIIRMHQFDKLEMEIFSTSETGLDEHKLMIALQEYLVQKLGLPYRFIQKCTFDIGKPNASGIDIDCWFPGQNRYIETHTADYMTDYQARDLKTRVKRTDGSTQLVHTNDATAFALGRILAAITENYQTADGSITVPEVLRGYLGGREQI
jgi:seryl-tRNA synthetase